MSGKTSNRTMIAIIVFMVGTALVGAEVYGMFSDKFAAMDGAFIDELAKENILLLIMIMVMAIAPAIGLMILLMNFGGKKIGEEAEQIARGLNP
jgi:hypothetical protein